jgi:hypothetical protein
LSQFIPSSVTILSELISFNPVFLGLVFTLIFTFSKAIGGLMFAIAFYIAARSVTRMNIVRDYMFIASFGIVLFFLSGQTTAIEASYPPFGLISITAIGFTRPPYLCLVMYQRQSIRKTVVDQTKFLERIGTAQMEREVQLKVLDVTREQNERMEEEGGVTSSFTDDEVKNYMQEVLKEVKGHKT